MKELGDPKTNQFTPDFDCECGNCSQIPTVKLEDKDGNVLTHFEMCGPCMFGESKMIDPDKWNH
ncbi:hypothetical protein ACYUFO_002210 [Vibrio parahaemolyticus]